MNQLEIHSQIDEWIAKGPDGIRFEKVVQLISGNDDSRRYFFFKADHRWLNWLWDNGFLEAIKQQAEDPTRYGYRTPELNYLVKVVEKNPAKVTDIMLKVPISAGTFNPEVISQFLRICSTLPSNQLKRIVPKIHNEKWIPLMGNFSDWGFEFEKMYQTLYAARDFESTLTLAEAVLSIRPKEEIAKDPRSVLSENPFYFKDLSYTKVFEYLSKIDKSYYEKALGLLTNVLAEVVKVKQKDSEKTPFEIYDALLLSDTDFFELKLGGEDRHSHRDDLKNLVATIIVYAKELIGNKCDEEKSITQIYNTYFETLPDSQSMWRLKLFVLSLCPTAFKDKLERKFNRVFEEDNYAGLISGAEYLKALKASFHTLTTTERNQFIDEILEFFDNKAKESPEEDWHKTFASRILSVLADSLNEGQRKKAKAAGFDIRGDYQPEPIIGKMRGGSVISRGPIPQEEFDSKPITEIVEKLKNEWKPEELSKQNTHEDFLNPLNAEGVGEMIRSGIRKRSHDYLENALLFFDKEELDQHYTYSFLRGIQELVKEEKSKVKEYDWSRLIELLDRIKTEKPSGDEKRDRSMYSTWLSNWTGVHSAMVDVLQELLREEGGEAIINFTDYRYRIFGILKYLLGYQDPKPEDEQPKNSSSTTKSPGDSAREVSDPFMMAINSTRGRAFEAFLLFMYQDDQKNISADVKALYEEVLSKENTRAIMFMFGRYIASFYFRDRDWLIGLLPKIFSEEAAKKDLYTAAWEGYLSANLYKELFFDPKIQALYVRGMNLTDADYPNQKHVKDPDEGLAVHLALAFIYFPEFDAKHKLFKEFWSKADPEQKKEFIEFIGRHVFSRDSAPEWIKEKKDKIQLDRLLKFWDWALKEAPKEALVGFGSWVHSRENAIDLKQLVPLVKLTLEKTGGTFEWDHGMLESLESFAKASPVDTLAILRSYLLKNIATNEQEWFHMDEEVMSAFRELYNNPETKDGVYALINDLLPHRNGMFWGLKEVLSESNG